MYKGFKMKLYPGMEEEYERRHNLLWPEMQESILREDSRARQFYWTEPARAAGLALERLLGKETDESSR